MKLTSRHIAQSILIAYLISGCTNRHSSPKYFSATKSATLIEAKAIFPTQYHDAIDKTAEWFVKENDTPSDWFVSAKQGDNSEILIGMTHISGIKRSEEAEKKGIYILGNPSGKDGQCTYDLQKKEIISCGLWE